jgi:homoserine O-acetyltransferase
LYLSRATDLFDLAEHGGSIAAGLDRVGAQKITVIGVRSDLLFPLAQQRELGQGFVGNPNREVEFVELDSLQGHDSFLVDMDRMRPAIRGFFRSD